MAHDAPDWVLETQDITIVINEPVPPSPAKECAAGGIGRYSGTDNSYQPVESWTVAALKVGELKEIILWSNDFPNTYFKVTIGAVPFCVDTILPGVMPLVFGDLKLAAAAVVKVEAMSIGGASITVDAVITGKEIG